MITKKQLKLLRQINRKPRTVRWIRKKYSPMDPRDILSGMFTLVKPSDMRLPDDAILSITKEGIVEVEAHQCFDWQYVITNIVVPIVIGVASAVITNAVIALL